MNCRDCQELLQRHLDGEGIGEDPAQHLSECSECKAEHAAARRLEEGLRLISPPLVPAGFAGRTLSRVRAQRRARLRWRWTVAGVAMAASVLVGLLVWDHATQPLDEVAVVDHGTNHPPKAPQEVPVAKTKPEPTPVAPEPTLQETVQHSRIAMDQLANRFMDKTREQADVWRDVLAPVEVARVDFVVQQPAAVPKAGQPKSGLTTGMQTVTGLTKRGIGFLLRETPPMQPDQAHPIKDPAGALPLARKDS
jgi:hypothetical protein